MGGLAREVKNRLLIPKYSHAKEISQRARSDLLADQLFKFLFKSKQGESSSCV